jgi:phosphoribosylformylglycinamidine synthase
MDFKQQSCPVYLVSANDPNDLASLAATHRAMAKLIAAGHLAAVHDVSDGGYAVAAAEMCIASGLGLTLDPDFLAQNDPFAESAGRYVIELRASSIHMADALASHFAGSAHVDPLGFVQARPSVLLLSKINPGIKLRDEITVDELTRAWRGTLDW